MACAVHTIQNPVNVTSRKKNMQTFLKKLSLVLISFLFFSGSASAAVGSIQISQVADLNSELAVFFRSEGLKKGTSLESMSKQYEVTLGQQSLRVASVAEQSSSDSGIAVVLAIDVSASLNNQSFSKIKAGCIDLMSKLPKNSQVAVIAVGNEARLVSKFTGDLKVVRSVIEGLTPSDQETSLYESILASQDIFNQVGPTLPLRHAVVVITDGLDDSHRGYSKDEVLRKIAEGTSPVYSIGLLTPQGQSSQKDALRVLAELSRASGGSFSQAIEATVQDIIKDADKSFGNAWMVKVDCKTCVRDGALKRLQLLHRAENSLISDSRDVRLFPILTTAVASPPPPPVVAPTWYAKAWQWWQALALGYPWLPWAVGAALAVVLIISVYFGVRWFRARRANRPSETFVPHAWDTSMQFPGAPGRVASENEDKTDQVTTNAAVFVGRHVTIAMAGHAKQVVALNTQIKFGRASSNDIALPDDTESSSHHAEIVDRQGIPVLVDLGSTNGTYLNGTKIRKPEPLHDGDVIVVGSTEMRVYFE